MPSLSCWFFGLLIVVPALCAPYQPPKGPSVGRTVSSTLTKRGEPQTPEGDYPDTEPHPNQLDQLETAIKDAFELCAYVLGGSVANGIDSNSPIFGKYFNEADRATVKSVFSTIQPTTGDGNDLLDKVFLQKTDPDNACNDRTLAASYLEGDNPFIVTCPSLFKKKAVTPLNGAAQNDDYYISCDELLSGGSYTGTGHVSYKMNSLGMTLLHEYTHYDAMLKSV